MTKNNDLRGLKAMDLVMGYPCSVRRIFCFQADFSNKRALDRLKEDDYRDCGITCGDNPSPVSPRYALMRKVVFRATRDPQLCLKKARAKRKMKNQFRKLKDEQSVAKARD